MLTEGSFKGSTTLKSCHFSCGLRASPGFRALAVPEVSARGLSFQGVGV